MGNILSKISMLILYILLMYSIAALCISVIIISKFIYYKMTKKKDDKRIYMFSEKLCNHKMKMPDDCTKCEWFYRHAPRKTIDYDELTQLKKAEYSLKLP